MLRKRKCSFTQEDEGKLHMDLAKIKTILKWEPPPKVTKLRSFLSLVNYYWWQFIKGYSTIATPFTNLFKKQRGLSWKQECHQAFDALKKANTKESVLSLPNLNKHF